MVKYVYRTLQNSIGNVLVLQSYHPSTFQKISSEMQRQNSKLCRLDFALLCLILMPNQHFFQESPNQPRVKETIFIILLFPNSIL